MPRSRSLIVGVSLAALAAAAFAAPAAAAKPHVALVNGIPGKKVDICTNKKEVASKVRYGKKALRRTSTGIKKVTFRVAGPGKCKGQVLAKANMVFANDSDQTIVATKRGGDKIVVFDNVDLGPLPAFVDTAVAWRHAANIKDVGFSIGYGPVTIDVWEHAAGDIFWNRGDQQIDVATHGAQSYLMTMAVVVPFSEGVYAGPIYDTIYPGGRYEYIFVGTREGNAKIVKIRRSLDI